MSKMKASLYLVHEWTSVALVVTSGLHISMRILYKAEQRQMAGSTDILANFTHVHAHAL